MAFSSGTFSLVAGNPVVTGTTISSTWANNTLTDIATGLSTCVLKDGTQTTTGSVPFAAGIQVTTGITTNSTTFALVNTTATTVNFAGGASTALNIGHASGAISVAGTTTVASGKQLNLGTYAGRSGQESTNSLNLLNGTAPIGTCTNGVTLYSAAGKLWAMDAGGAATQLTP